MQASQVFDHWGEVRDALYAALASLTDEQIRFAPRAGSWSLGQTVCHIAATEEWWMARAAADSKEWPDYEAADYPTSAALRSLLERVHEKTLSCLAGWDTDDLDQEVVTPSGRRRTRRWIVWHVLEHEIHHRGEVFLMMGMQGLEVPDI